MLAVQFLNSVTFIQSKFYIYIVLMILTGCTL